MSALLLLLVPVGRVTITFPNEVVLGVSCIPGNTMGISLYEENPCNAYTNISEAQLQVQACGVVCRAAQTSNRSYEADIMNTPSYKLTFHNFNTTKAETYTYTLKPEDHIDTILTSETKNHQTLKNNIRYTSAVRKVSKNAYFFPGHALFNFTCGYKDDQYGCLYGNMGHLYDFDSVRNSLIAKLHLEGQTQQDILEERKFYKSQGVKDVNGGLKTAQCYDGLVDNEHIFVSVPMSDNSSDIHTLELNSCALRCIATSPRKQFCSNDQKLVEYDVQLTFWSYLGIRVFIGIIGGTAYTMFEGAVIACLREYKADYGLQRVYAAIGGMISSPLSGWMIDYFSEGKGYTDFR